MHLLNSEMRGIAGLIGCWSTRMMEHWDIGVMGCWSIGILVHWDTGAHHHCNRKFKCGNLVEFDLSADCVHECNCNRSSISLSLSLHLSILFLTSSLIPLSYSGLSQISSSLCCSFLMFSSN